LQREGAQQAHQSCAVLSQSPYGAKWFATYIGDAWTSFAQASEGRNPLTGLSGLQPGRSYPS